MGGDGGRTALAPRLAWAIPVGFLLLHMVGRVITEVFWAGTAGAVATILLFVLPLLYAVPHGRVVWGRYRGWLLATQAALTYLPIAVFGSDNWVPGLASGLLAGLLLLTMTSPWSWVLAGAAIAADALRAVVLGNPDNTAGISWTVLSPVSTGLAFFGLVRLADLVTDLHAARTELAALAVTRERRRAAERLRAAVGDQLETVTALARTALALLPGNRGQARARLTEAAGSARRALAQVRTMTAAGRAGADAGQDDRRAGVQLAGGGLAPRLARLVLMVVVGASAGIRLAYMLDAGGPGLAMAGAVATIVAVVALQLYHSLARQAGSRPRGWRWTLTAQTLLPFAWFHFHAWTITLLAGFAAGSALLLLPLRWAWTVVGVVLAGIAVQWTLPVLGIYTSPYYGIYGPYGLSDSAALTAGTAATAMVVYGLSRLTDLAEQVEASRTELARAAVERERLRVAQDTHDLLGLGLSGVALKCDLAVRLIGRDDARAKGELETLLRLAAQARADILAVTTGDHGLSLRAELPAARDLLVSAGIDVQLHDEGAAWPLPAVIDGVLATVLREAVTNVLRHATATRCQIELTAGEDAVSLRVANDGVTDKRPDQARGQEPERRAGGRGLANLAARAAALGGRLTTRAEGDTFEVTVRVPLPAGSAPRRVEDRLAARDPADGIDEVVGDQSS